MRGIKKRGGEGWKRLGVFLLLLFVLLVLINSVRKVYNKKQNAEEALTRMDQDVEKLMKREQELKNAEFRLKSEEGFEFELRKKFSVARAGESVAIIVDEEASSTSSSESSSLWQKFKNLFKF